MSKKIVLKKGQRFKRLKVLYEFGEFPRGNGWVCRCDCGRMKIYTAHDLVSGKVSSCGCLRAISCTYPNSALRNIRKTYFNLYSVCYNPDNPKYEQFGGIGIGFCPEWEDEKNGLKAFEKWSYDCEATPKARLYRIDMERGYDPNNCAWVYPPYDLDEEDEE